MNQPSDIHYDKKESSLQVTDLAIVALCPLALAASDAARGSLLGIATALCLLCTVFLLRLFRGLVPVALLLPLLLLLCCTVSFLLRITALLCCYPLALELFPVLPLAAVSTFIMITTGTPSYSGAGVLNYAIWSLAILSLVGILRGLLAYGELYVHPENNIADGLLPLLAQAPGAFIVLAIMLAVSRLVQRRANTSS